MADVREEGTGAEFSPQQSPVAAKATIEEGATVADFTIDFAQAVNEAFRGKKVTKEEWNNSNVYIYVKDDALMLHKEDGKDYSWIISRADYDGTDWKTIN